MTIGISSAALQQIRAEAAATEWEICGLLFGAADQIEEACACANVAADPASRFEIDPVALLAAHRAMRAGGPQLVGCYHSHPGGSARPSPRDAAAAAPDGMIWLIAAGGDVTAWRAVEAGPVAGRFAPIALDVMPPGCVGAAVSPERSHIETLGKGAA
ncbi:MAG TPA: M67 family metallopeptidase [Sphingomonas sp.]|nr:M67 family metallopeptidase [Sphingomonas sp.]